MKLKDIMLEAGVQGVKSKKKKKKKKPTTIVGYGGLGGYGAYTSGITDGTNSDFVSGGDGGGGE